MGCLVDMPPVLDKRSEGVSRIGLVGLVELGFESGSLADMGIEWKRPALGVGLEVLPLKDKALEPKRPTDWDVDVSPLRSPFVELEDVTDEGVDLGFPNKPTFEGVRVDALLIEGAELKLNRLPPVDLSPT